jgi:hypothetical protein
LKQALAIDTGSAELHYIAGLYYVDIGDFASAREQAWAAYAAGYPLPGLHNRLAQAGEWKDPPDPEQSKAPE